MAYDLAKVTTNGNNLIAQILANKSSLSIDKIEISDTQLPSTTDISTMTSVPKVVQTVSANGFSKNSNTLIVSTVVDNSSIRADYKAWVFGIWGSDSQNGQSQLIAVITSTNSPDTIPAFSGRTPVSYTYKFNIGFSNASQIKFKMINGSFATNDTVVHTTGDETIDGQKKFNTDPTDGAGNAYAKTVDVNQQLDKKVNVADMRKPASDVAGIEEVSTLQTQVDNSAVGTNLLAGTSSSEHSYTGDFSTTPGWANNTSYVNPCVVNVGSTYTYSIYLTKLTGSFVFGYWSYDSNKNYISWIYSSIYSSSGKISWTFTVPDGVSYIAPHVVHASDDFTCTAKGEKLELGSHATDWTPAPEDKVNVSDMRKPASDVVGIDEVNTKQDKIGYTPADDSKVVHSTVTQLNSTDMNTVLTAGFYQSINGTNGIPGGDNWTIYQVIPLSGGNGVQVAYETNNAILGMRSYNYSRGLTFTSWVQFADDSKVPHLSGTNNFDTVPTVDNNPLLLASSLPSDLARTGSDQEFTGKNTFDTAPIDKTTGNPYITKDGVPSIPSDVARTGQAQTFTAAQTFSIAPTIKDASKDKGDTQAATMADLKSVEKSAWRQLDNSHIIFYYAVAGTHHTDCLYKIDPVNKKIYIHWIIQFEDRSNDGAVYLDFSSVVSQFTSQGPGKIMCQEVDHRRDISSNYDFSISGSQISFNTSFDSSVYASGPLEDCWFGYDKLLI